MRGMDAFTKLLMTAAAACACLLLLAGPVTAAEEPAGDAPADDPAAEQVDEGGEEADGERIPIAETPRDRIGLILLAALLVGTGAAVANGRRQLKGERPQATGEFRWR